MLTSRERIRLVLCIGTVSLSLAVLFGLSRAVADSDAPARASLPARPAVFTLHVPPGALVRFEGIDTEQDGRTRRFVTAPLTPGREYSYELTVTWIEGSQAVVRKRHITFWSGEHITLDFGPPTAVKAGFDLYEDPAAPNPSGTAYYNDPLNDPYYAPIPRLQGLASGNQAASAEILLRVPADAEILFDGVLTKQKGPQRLFITPALRAGKKYHYEIVARWMQNGKTVRHTRQVEVSAGATVNVTFAATPAK
jgi:uncharacterized protein (TIGR03000 family)